MRKQAALGVDPAEARKVQKAAVEEAQANTFKAVAMAWHAKFKPQWSLDHANTILSRLNDNAFPWIGNKPIRDVKSGDIVVLMDSDGGARRDRYCSARASVSEEDFQVGYRS